MSDSTISLTMNFKKAFSVAAAGGLAISMPSQAQLLGGDAVTLTGVFDTVIERTRSCSISTVSDNNDSNQLDLFGQRGNTIRLTRRAGSSNATGSVGVAFDASGANAVYFEDFQVGKLTTDRTEIESDGDGDGKIVLALAKVEVNNVVNRNGNAAREAREQLDGISISRNDKITVDNDGSQFGFILGGQSGKKNNANSTLTLIDKNHSLPAVRRATATMTIQNVATQGTSAIQATLVCQPLALKPTVGNITPIN